MKKSNLINYSPNKRLLAVIMLIAFIFIAISGKFFYVQIIQGQSLQKRALDQWYRDIDMVAPRGQITDKNGVVLADSYTLYDVYARPSELVDKDATAKILADCLDLDKDKILDKLGKKVSEVTIDKKVDGDIIQELAKNKVTGIYISSNVNRIYPYGNFMSQVLGFTNVDNIGQTGVENYYNNYLSGINGKIYNPSDLIGRERDNDTKYYLPYVQGNKVQLTLDYNIQAFAENAVKSAQLYYNAKSASCLIMDVTDGSIVAMAEAPTYDLNDLPRDDLDLLNQYSKNSMISSVFEPGSTFKILTSAIGLEEKAFSSDHKFHCNGSRAVDGQKIKCWKSKGHGTINFAEGVTGSCNCVFMDIALHVGTETYYDYIDKFGLMKKTGIDLIGETSGLSIKEENVKNVDLARIGFGQAIAVTPIELATAIASVINGGTMYTPHILDSIISPNGEELYNYVDMDSKKVISESTSIQMRALLEDVVKNGSGKASYVEGYRIGGKTGTAQKYENGAIATGKYVSSFVGFAPVDDPKYMTLFIVDEPKGYVYYGSMVAAPYVGDIFQNIFEYLDIPPQFSVEDKLIIGEPFTLPNLVGLTYNEARYQLYKLGLNYELVGDGDIVTTQIPAVGTEVDKRNTVLLYLN